MTHLRKMMLEELERRNYAQTFSNQLFPCYAYGVLLAALRSRSIHSLI